MWVENMGINIEQALNKYPDIQGDLEELTVLVKGYLAQLINAGSLGKLGVEDVYINEPGSITVIALNHKPVRHGELRIPLISRKPHDLPGKYTITHVEYRGKPVVGRSDGERVIVYRVRLRDTAIQEYIANKSNPESLLLLIYTIIDEILWALKYFSSH
ncbi:hypothetical protein [Desulfurococcus sp.]|uniref:hypothetical protein n=2 Tax=Desulfurococcus sp. TaxID=51678 RepID=UPI0031666CBC